MTTPANPSAKRVATFKKDFLASVVVFLVALPLCMGVAIASGAPVAAGLITGIIGGLIVGWFAGCPLQVSGPAAGLTVIVYEIIQRFGLEMLGAVVLIAGVLQMLAGIFRLGQWFRAVSPAVVQGMLAGIGVLILASQFHVMVDDKPKGRGIENLLTIPQAVAKGLSIPDFESRAVRDVRTKTLREVGELHRQQVSLQETLAERIPHSPAGESDPDREAVGERPMAFDDLLPQQTAIHSKLTELINRLTELERQDVNSDRATRINIAAASAAEHSRSALEALDRGQPAEILESQASAVAAFETLLDNQKNHSMAAGIGLLTILLVVLWQTVSPARLRLVPGPLVAIVVVTVVSAVLVLPVIYVEVPDRLWNEIHLPSATLLLNAPWWELTKAALLVAVVASAETLLAPPPSINCTKELETQYDRELFAQGLGNATCGILGALPMTGVIVRSSANVQAGGQSRMSSILHGLWLLIFVAGLAFLLRMIPTAGLAAILVYTGYKLVNVQSILKLKEYGWSEVVIYAATVFVIVASDLLTGVIVGIVLAAIKLLYTFSHLVTHLEITPDKGQAVLSLEGAATFIRLPVLARELERVPRNAELHIDLSHLDYVDHACLNLMMTWAKQHESTGGSLSIDWESLHARFRLDKPRAQKANGRLSVNENGGPTGQEDQVDNLVP